MAGDSKLGGRARLLRLITAVALAGTSCLCWSGSLAGLPDADLPSGDGQDSGPDGLGYSDAGPMDAGDAGPIDAGDAGPRNARDAGPRDAGADTGASDAGPGPSCTWAGQAFPRGAAQPDAPSLCCKAISSTGAQWVPRLQPSVYQVGATPIGVTAADFDGDGSLGLAVIVEDENHQLVRLRSTTAGYVDAGVYPISPIGNVTDPFYPWHLAAADLNGDGRADIVVANGYDQSYEVFLSQPDGTLSGKTYPLSGGPYWVDIVDVDGDGILDLVMPLDYPGQVVVLKGLGDGSFGPAIANPAGDRPDSLFIGDFDGDGVADVAVANVGDDTILVLRGLPDGGFSMNGTYPPSVPSQFGLNWVTGGDLDGDGRVDLVATNDLENEVVLLLGNGDGTFAAPIFFMPSAEFSPSSAIVADIDGDGRNELVVSSEQLGSIDVFRWNAATSSLEPWLSSTTSMTWPLSLIALPHPGSKTFDLAYVNGRTLSDTVTVLVNGCP
jgi:FG-GAP-like repeat